jgi:hypothetical protein
MSDPFNSSNVVALGQQCGGYIDPQSLETTTYLEMDGRPSTVDAKGYICPINEICQVSRCEAWLSLDDRYQPRRQLDEL